MKKGEDRDRDRDRGSFGGDKDGDRGGERRQFQKRRGCRFCGENALLVDYKDKNLLHSFITERFKIVPRRISGLCASHQRELTTAVKRARHIAILAYTTAQM